VKIGAVVLAAGGSSRLGQPKQLLRHRGESLVRHAAQAAIDAGCAPVTVVVGPEQERIAASLHDLDVIILPNESWRRGMGTSIRAGVEALKDCDAIAILACDQPQVDATLIRQLAARHQETRKPMVASAYAGTLGVPTLFMRSCFEQLLSLGDERGAKVLLTARPNDVAQVDFPGGAVDIDTPGDWGRLGSAGDNLDRAGFFSVL
jgi:molybdenum cofactor cytidylyltransferase